MKRYGWLWEQIVSFENLSLAAQRARHGKRTLGYVRNFEFDREWNLLCLQNELVTGAYRPGCFRTHWIRRPKPRLISAAPYRDRVVHHALMNPLEPILDRHFHAESYACRVRKGTHAAADRIQALMRQNRYVLQCDIRKFFPSIDHEIMKAIFRHLLKDPRTLWLMDLIVDGSNPQEPAQVWFPDDLLWTPIERRRGLPIGNLTSQWFANWYLDGLDHFVTSRLGIGAYLRYCDDFLLLSNEKRRLRDAYSALEEWLVSRRLRLHNSKRHVRDVRAGVTFVGYRIWPTHRALPKTNLRAFRRRVRWMRNAYAEGRLDLASVKSRLDGWLGHARQADCRFLLEHLSKEWVFGRKQCEEGAEP